MATRHEQTHDDSFGVLVGWSHRGFDGKLDLCLQRINSLDRENDAEVEEHHFVMTDSQAHVLANYLNQVLGSRYSQQRKRGLLSRLLGG